VPAVTDTNPVGEKSNMPVEDGDNVIVFVQVAPAGTVSPANAKPELPYLKLVDVQGVPTAKSDILFPPLGNGKVNAPLFTAEVPELAIVTVKTTEPDDEVTDAALSDVDTVADATDVAAVVEVPPDPPPPHAARVNATPT
jgi:hypothetical protein